MTLFRSLFAGFLFLSTAAFAQSQVTFGGLALDSTGPVEISADQLSVDQNNNNAVFSGNVVIGQGDMRMSASSVEVIYKASGGIAELRATGGVTIVTSAEEVEAQQAVYSLENDTMFLTGDVLLNQGNSALSANIMRVNLKDGTALLEGRVRTVLQAGPSE